MIQRERILYRFRNAMKLQFSGNKMRMQIWIEISTIIQCLLLVLKRRPYLIKDFGLHLILAFEAFGCRIVV